MTGMTSDLSQAFELGLQNSSVIAWETNADLQITSITGKPLEKTGIQPQKNHALSELFQIKDSDHKLVKAHQEALSGKKSKMIFDWDSMCFELVIGPSKKGVVVFGVDVSDRRLLENQFKESQKMESLGRLAGGIAHYFNNILTVILNYSELLEMDFQEDKNVKPKLEAIANCANKAASLTSQLLAFSRQKSSNKQDLDLNILLSSLSQMLSRVIGEDIELTIHQQETVGKISANPSELLNLMMSLSESAKEAMPEGGTLRIETSQSGDETCLTFKSSGPGLKSDPKSLTYHAAAKAMKEYGGRIESEKTSKGSSVCRLYFKTKDSLGNSDKSSKDNIEAKPTKKTVLVVEDEDIVRQVTCDIIKSGGFNVLEATNALNALEVLEKEKNPVDLVLTDLVMPKMNGPELVKKLTAKYPKLGVVYMSGYNSEAAFGNGLLTEEASFVQKPFMPKALIRAVEGTLKGEIVAEA